MIKADELRLGNWYDDYGNYKQVTPNDILKAWESERFWMEPIPLTPEILEKCGFVVLESNDVLNITHAYNGYLSLNTYTNGGEYWWLRYYQGGTNAKIKSLHQLQNLYYALTGQELTYNP